MQPASFVNILCNKKQLREKMNFFKSIKEITNRSTMSEAMLSTLHTEQLNGLKIANIFRFGFSLIYTFLIFFYSVENEITIEGNIEVALLFWIITIVQMILLRFKKKYALGLSPFLVVLDFFIVFFMIHVQSYGSDGHNFVLATKNINYWLVIFFIILHSLQLQIKYLTVSVISAIAVQMALVALAVYEGPEYTNNIHESIMGPKFHLQDALIRRPILVSLLGLMLSYFIYRSILMMRTISLVEGQKQLLSRYFSPDIVDDIIKNPEVIQKGKRQKVAVLFLDIRNFTQLSEIITAEELVDFLTRFRSRVTQIVLENGGSIDKFIGDAVMATFGTPIPSEIANSDTLSAVEAARIMLKNLPVEFEPGGMSLKFGIGIHTGECIAGNIGEKNMLEYTVIGDVVNTASRIESLCKIHPYDCLVSEAVKIEAEQNFNFIELEATQLKGKTEKMKIYSPVF
jgi:adenylate cyclase